MTKWTQRKLWRKALSKYWEVTGYGSAVKLVPVVIGVIIAIGIIGSHLGSITTFASSAAVIGGFIISLPFVMAEVANEELKTLTLAQESFKAHADEVDKLNTKLTHQMYEMQGENTAFVYDRSVSVAGKFVGKATSLDFPLGAKIGWFEIDAFKEAEIQVGSTLEWRGYNVEITKIGKRVGKSVYGVKGKIVKLPLLRHNIDDVIGED